MPRLSTRPPTNRPSGGERIFADGEGRSWSAVQTRTEAGGAVEFVCVSDSRQAVRAIAIESSIMIADVSEETLQGWLRDAPRIGRLT